MLPIILGILVTISSLMLAFFLAVSNVSFIVENDFMSKAYNNAAMHALSEGQIFVRAGVMGPVPKVTAKKVNPGYLRDFHDGTFTNVSYNITYLNTTVNNTTGGSIDADITIK
jgi:hypothetical protein